MSVRTNNNDDSNSFEIPQPRSHLKVPGVRKSNTEVKIFTSSRQMDYSLLASVPDSRITMTQILDE